MKSSIKPYQRFYEAIPSTRTRTNYELWLSKFLKYSKTEPDELVSLKPSDIEDLVFNYVVDLKRRAEKGVLSPNSLKTMIAPIQLFCEVNKITLDWKNLKKILPRPVATTNQGAWTDEQIVKILEHTTSLRNKAIIHFLASSGARVGSLYELNFGDIKPIEDGAIVWIYGDDKERYRTFLTPESYKVLKDYFELRLLKGYPVTDESDPVFCKRDHHTRITYHGSREIIPKILKIAGLRGHRAEKKVSSKSPNHAFRKRFELILVNAGIHSKTIEALCGSSETSRDNHYFKHTITDEQLWKQYKKAIPLLTINLKDRLKDENAQLRHVNEEYENQLKKQVAEIENRYQNVFDSLTMQAWQAKMKLYFREQLEGRGHVHTNPKYRDWMKKFVECEDVSDMLKLTNAPKDMIRWHEEVEKEVKKRQKDRGELPDFTKLD